MLNAGAHTGPMRTDLKCDIKPAEARIEARLAISNIYAGEYVPHRKHARKRSRNWLKARLKSGLANEADVEEELMYKLYQMAADHSAHARWSRERSEAFKKARAGKGRTFKLPKESVKAGFYAEQREERRAHDEPEAVLAAGKSDGALGASA